MDIQTWTWIIVGLTFALYMGIAVWSKAESIGEFYIADRGNHVIRKIDRDGIITTVAGQIGQFGFQGDGGRATDAKLRNPYGVDFDSQGNLYIADTHNHRLRVVYK